MRTVPLRETAVIKLNGAGAGTAKVGPLSAREVWHPSNAAVNTTQTTIVNESQCEISVGDTGTRTFRDSCVDGSTGDSTGKVSADTIHNSEYVWAEWTGGDANVYATLTVTGTKDI